MCFYEIPTRNRTFRSALNVQYLGITTQAHNWRTLPKNNCYPAPLPPSFIPQLQSSSAENCGCMDPGHILLTPHSARDINHSSLHTLHLHSQHYIPIYWLVVDNT